MGRKIWYRRIPRKQKYDYAKERQYITEEYRLWKRERVRKVRTVVDEENSKKKFFLNLYKSIASTKFGKWIGSKDWFKKNFVGKRKNKLFRAFFDIQLAIVVLFIFIYIKEIFVFIWGFKKLMDEWFYLFCLPHLTIWIKNLASTTDGVSTLAIIVDILIIFNFLLVWWRATKDDQQVSYIRFIPIHYYSLKFIVFIVTFL